MASAFWFFTIGIAYWLYCEVKNPKSDSVKDESISGKSDEDKLE